MRLERRGSFAAYDLAGNRYTVIRWVQVRTDGRGGEVEAMSRLILPSGEKVYRTGPGQYEVRKLSGVVRLFSDDPHAD